MGGGYNDPLSWKSWNRVKTIALVQCLTMKVLPVFKYSRKKVDEWILGWEQSASRVDLYLNIKPFRALRTPFLITILTFSFSKLHFSPFSKKNNFCAFFCLNSGIFKNNKYWQYICQTKIFKFTNLPWAPESSHNQKLTLPTGYSVEGVVLDFSRGGGE